MSDQYLKILQEWKRLETSLNKNNPSHSATISKIDKLIEKEMARNEEEMGLPSIIYEE